MIEGIKIYRSSIFKDYRGYLWTSWKKSKRYKINFNHDKFSLSKRNVLRGLHYDSKTWKLVSCVYGSIFFVVVNCDRNSKQYLKTYTTRLNHTDNKQILVPPYFANGHLCLSNDCVFHYKLYYKGKYLDVKNQKIIKWNDKRLNIKWPKKIKYIMSTRDK